MESLSIDLGDVHFQYRWNFYNFVTRWQLCTPASHLPKESRAKIGSYNKVEINSLLNDQKEPACRKNACNWGQQWATGWGSLPNMNRKCWISWPLKGPLGSQTRAQWRGPRQSPRDPWRWKGGTGGLGKLRQLVFSGQCTERELSRGSPGGIQWCPDWCMCVKKLSKTGEKNYLKGLEGIVRLASTGSGLVPTLNNNSVKPHR